jgi:hypothetical protein
MCSTLDTPCNALVRHPLPPPALPAAPRPVASQGASAPRSL